MVVNCYQNLKFVKTNVLDYWLIVEFSMQSWKALNAVQYSWFDENPMGKGTSGTLELVY